MAICSDSTDVADARRAPSGSVLYSPGPEQNGDADARARWLHDRIKRYLISPILMGLNPWAQWDDLAQILANTDDLGREQLAMRLIERRQNSRRWNLLRSIATRDVSAQSELPDFRTPTSQSYVFIGTSSFTMAWRWDAHERGLVTSNEYAPHSVPGLIFLSSCTADAACRTIQSDIQSLLVSGNSDPETAQPSDLKRLITADRAASGLATLYSTMIADLTLVGGGGLVAFPSSRLLLDEQPAQVLGNPLSTDETPPLPDPAQAQIGFDEPWDERLQRLRDAQSRARAAADLATDELDRAIAGANEDGHTQSQIAEVLGVSQPLVHRLIRRGRNADLASPLALARRYRAGLLDRDRLMKILAASEYHLSDTGSLGYNDLPDQGAWAEVIQAHRAGYLTDEDYAELAERVFGSAASEDTA